MGFAADQINFHNINHFNFGITLDSGMSFAAADQVEFQNRGFTVRKNRILITQPLISGVDIRDEDIPAIKSFNKVTLATFVAYLVIFTFASILMLAGVAARKSFLLVPW